MLTPPALSADTIISTVRDAYGLRRCEATFLPIGADVNSAVYRVAADDGTLYFLKVRRADFDEMAVAVPAFLHAQGIRQVMAPLATTTDQLWVERHDLVWILYPFVEGHNGFVATLSDAQWVAFGQSLRAIHAAVLPPALARRVPREAYSPQWRDIVTAFDHEVETRVYDDPIAEGLAAFWRTKRQEIRALVAHAAELGQALRERALPLVLCHTDLHAGNLLVSAQGELCIVDWDNPLLAPKERDLMFIGGGIGAIWDTAREETLFYQGYGPTEIDPLALAYYRNERIVADLAAYGTQIFDEQGSVEDRQHGLEGTMGQFRPGRVVEIAHRTYQRLR
jgi:spectinomycin phosphotransferase